MDPIQEHSSKTNPTSSSSSAKTSTTKHNGVADYFAILGVGDKLVWKHDQKQSMYVQPEQEPLAAEEADGDDDLAQERFGREIVDITIVAMEHHHHDDTTTTDHNDHTTTTDNNSYHCHEASTGTADHQQHHLPHVMSDISDTLPHLSAIVVTTSMIPLSPSQCSDTTGTHTTSAQQSQQQQQPLPQLANTADTTTITVQEQHWIAIQKTLPAATPGFVPILLENEDGGGESVDGGGESFDGNSYSARGEEEEEDRPSSSSAMIQARGPQLWTKYQTWNANLSWNFGLRAELYQHRAKVLRKVTANPAPLKGIHSKLQSKLKQVMWVGGTASGSSTDNNDHLHHDTLHNNHPWGWQQKFLLAYQRRRKRKRGSIIPPHQSSVIDEEEHDHEEICPEKKDASSLEEYDDVDDYRPGIADLRLFYVRLHRNLLVPPHPPPPTAAASIAPTADDAESIASEKTTKSSLVLSSLLLLDSAGALASQAKAQFAFFTKSDAPSAHHHHKLSPDRTNEIKQPEEKLVSVQDYLNLPEGFEEWCIPQDYQWIREPSQAAEAAAAEAAVAEAAAAKKSSDHHNHNMTSRLFSFQTAQVATDDPSAIEVAAWSSSSQAAAENAKQKQPTTAESLAPVLFAQPPQDADEETLSNFRYIPIVAYRRQRIGDEERYHEDPAIIELAVTFLDANGRPVMPIDLDDEPDNYDDLDFAGASNNTKSDEDFGVLDKTPWTMAGKRRHQNSKKTPTARRMRRQFGSPTILVRKNRPFGFADAAFATKVLDRFPNRNYKGLPLPQEELPMFCYPTGCRLFRARYSDAPLAQYYGFVVKNERGDSIYVSCVSFMEPLTTQKVEQLARMSEKRKRTSLPHKKFCEKREKQHRKRLSKSATGDDDTASECSTEADSNFLLTGFDDMTTFENKTICLVSRYPFWTAFRKFLSHLHISSGSVTDIPLERWISHLLLSVPLPRPGGHNVIVPLTSLNEPMVLTVPPEKDFPLLDLPLSRLVACLEINTIVMIVLGMLALEKKVIVMSTRPSLVLDVCELLRSLLFPFELCAPYVPRLTEPFKSSLDFPGAIFVGIHDDGSPHGLAATVRKQLPEDSIVVDLETGEIESVWDRLDVLKSTWDILPRSSRGELVKELQTLCSDASINDGQEPLDSQYDSAFGVSLPDAIEDVDIVIMDDENNLNAKEPLDDRAFRDAFLRFFCKVLGGYERFLVVPDADFLISGNDYFDSQGFLASVRSDRSPYLGALVSTQLFQSFIQRRTESSDVHCLLFDECIQEYHAFPKPYGRLGDDVETVPGEGNEKPRVVYSLLVDQSAAFPIGHDHQSFLSNRSFDGSEADSGVVNPLKPSFSFTENHSKYAESAFNPTGDLVTAPSRDGLPPRQRYIYCIDGNPCFPHKFSESLFLPKEPESWLVETSKTPNPLLARSERELDEADRRRRMATSHRGFQKQRRCLWQLPKLMGSHFLGAWLLCIPAQVSQPRLSHDQQARYLMRALGALRILRSKQRIVPDEAAYRALMVACGRSKNDRRTELVKLFGLLRSDGIFPSAVTLGQYTRALAEGYSKQLSAGNQEEDGTGGEVGAEQSASKSRRKSAVHPPNHRLSEWEATLGSMDGHLGPLEDHGRRWRTKQGSDIKDPEFGREQEERKKRSNRSWLPVVYSSSFVPVTGDMREKESRPSIQFVAMWSKTRACRNCSYIPLEEEVQAGWDIVGGDDESSGAISCPRCGSLFVPMLGVREIGLDEAKRHADEMNTNRENDSELSKTADFVSLPPQICPQLASLDVGGTSRIQFVAYKSPAAVRVGLEHYVEEYGEDILCREKLRELDPELLYNFWWYCARFSLPLPLSVVYSLGDRPTHCIAFAGWDQAISERACFSAAQVIAPIFDGTRDTGDNVTDQIDPFDEHPLLSRFNLPGFYSNVWDHLELSKILVSLVEACDKRDFKPVVDCVVQKNRQRKAKFSANERPRDGQSSLLDSSDISDGVSVELDVYRTILYLAKYQCTTAFHAFFPAMVKPCKGYHFWCAIGQPLPMFDRLFRDGVQRLQKEKVATPPIHDVSEVALGFRCVFGHII